MSFANVLARLGIGQWDYDESGRRRPGAWSQSFSGQQFWPLDPRAEEIHFDDICMGLRDLRYRSQTREPYNVLTHSVLVSVAAEREARYRAACHFLQYGVRLYPEGGDAFALLCARHGLMHDAAEAYIGDIGRPLKRQRAMRGYLKLEAKWERAIFKRFDIQPTKESTAVVDEIDKRIVLNEIDALMVDPDMWPRNGRYLDLEPLDIEIPDWTWRQSVDAYCQRFTELWPEWPEVTYARKHAEQNPIHEDVYESAHDH